MKPVGRHGNRDRFSVDPGAITQDVAVYTRHKRSPWCLTGGKVTVTVTPSLVCPRIRQRENRGMQRHSASKSGPTTGSMAARLGKTRTAQKIHILRRYGKYDTHRHTAPRPKTGRAVSTAVLPGPSFVMDVANLMSPIPLDHHKWADSEFEIGMEAGWSDSDS